MAAVSTGNFRRFERFAVVLCVLSLLLVPVLVSIHPPVGQMTRDFFIPNWPAHSKLSDVMLLVIGIVGTTVAPWQLFFQQSYIVDKRITPRFMKYDNWLQVFSALYLRSKAHLARVASDTSELCRMPSLWRSIWRKANHGKAFPRS